MERDIKNYAQELADLRNQLKNTLAVVNRKQKADENLVNSARLQVNFEALSSQNDRLNQQLHSFNKKLIELTRENADFRELVRILRLKQSNFAENYEKILKAMSSLNE
jgi:predicted  nucleic acid-binding Zn-ribbon protein